MNAEQVIRTIAGYQEAISRVVVQLEEIQVAFNAQFDDFKAQHDAKLEELAEQVTGRLDAAGDELRSAIRARIPTEMAMIEERRRKVREEHLPRREQAAKSVLETAKTETAELRALNPELDSREEGLKSEKATLEAQLQKLNAEISSRSRGLGGILRFVSLSRADRERHRVLGRLEAVGDSLYQVRRIWAEQRSTIEARQAAYQEEWRAETVAVARLQAELDQLDSQPRREALAFDRAVRSVLDGLSELVECEDPELSAGVAEMAGLNDRTDSYHHGLAQAAGLIGLLRGLDSGLEAVNKSITGLQREQAMHSAHLKPLDFDLPQMVAAFHRLWPVLAERFADEKHLSLHPAAFSKDTEPLISGPLSEESIKAMFDALGTMISDATKAWGHQ